MNHGLEKEMLEQFGPLIGGQELQRALGFKSAVTYRRAARLEQLPVKVFELQGRRGKFALTSDVVQWLETLRGNQPTAA